MKCLKCNEIIESKSVHNLVPCKCGACFVDGGKDYFGFGVEDFSKMLIIYDDGKEELINNLSNLK